MYGETCSQEVISKLVGSRCEASVEIEGDRVSCLLDSGSQVSTMSISYFNRHLSDSFSLHPIGKLVTIEAANGLPIPYLGFVQVNIELAPDLTACQASTSVLMFVCPDTPYTTDVPIILGTNVLHEICSQTDAEQRSLPALDNVLKTFRAAEAIRDGHIGKVRVCSRRAIVIRPGDTVVVRGRCTSRQHDQPYPAIVEGMSTQPASQDGLAVVSAVVTMQPVSRPVVKVPVQDLTGHNIRLPARAVFAELFSPVWIRPIGTGYSEPHVTAGCMKATVTTHDVIDVKHIEECHIGPELPTRWEPRVRSLLASHADVFSRNDIDVGTASQVRHRISLNDYTPFKERSRPIASRDLDDDRNHIHDLIDAGIIRESNNQYASPIVLVRKKYGSLRLTVDYRKLNRRTIKDAYALPRIDDAFSHLSGAKWFSVVDLKSGYYHVEMEPDDRAKTAFVCPLGFFEYTIMPQGITNAPATFQRLMEKCMGEMNLRHVLAFLDDMIVFSSTLEEHEERLGQVLDRLRTFGLKLNPKKCSFFCRSVSYLGHTVSETGIGCDPSKVDAVREWPRPQNMRDLKSFLGFSSFYRKFVRSFSKQASPLNDLLKGYTKAGPDKRLKTDTVAVRKPFGASWTMKCEDAFNALKASLIEAPVLAIADPAIPYELHTDASGSGLGAALYQRHDSVLRPVAYASRGLSISESRYPAHKL